MSSSTTSLTQTTTSFPPWLDGSTLEQERSLSSADAHHRNYQRAVSSNSLISSASVVVQPLRVRNENVVPSRTMSTIDFNEPLASTASHRRLSRRVSHRSSWGTDIPVPPQPCDPSAPEFITESLEDISLDANNNEPNMMNSLVNEFLSGQPSDPRLSYASDKENVAAHSLLRKSNPTKGDPHYKSHPFRKWVDTIHRKRFHRHQTSHSRKDRWSLDDFDDPPVHDTVLLQSPVHRKHRKSTSWASSGFVTAVKSASMSLATLSVAPHSQKARESTLIRSSNRSSRLSRSFNRASLDEASVSGPTIDEATRERAIKRRRILEELVESEESYVADLKVLVNVYFTLLATSTNSTHHKLTHVHENITEILILHEDLLSRLREIVPHSSMNIVPNSVATNLKVPQPTRRHSVNALPVTRSKSPRFDVRRSLDTRRQKSVHDRTLMSEPKEAATIALIFDEVMSQFFIYEEYGARYESMLHDMNFASRSIPNWPAYERGLEALANTLAPVNVREGCNRKGLTFGDLLIKPIQRVYCPESHGEVEKVLFRLRETAMEINQATNDQDARERIQRSWHLQDLLVFPDPTSAPFALRSLGHPVLCGVLHVAYQSRFGVLGRYTLCALFTSCLILGVPNDDSRHYTIMASIGLRDLGLEATDNGKGLQCHTAPYSWKVVFESNQHLFELILSACSLQEEQQWRDDIRRLAVKETRECFDHRPISHAQYPFLAMDLKPLGSILGQPGTLAHKISVKRAATVGPRTNVCQVFIRNTHALKDVFDSSNSGSLVVSRSQSLLSTDRIPVLAPRRVERIRMEHDLAKVWTKDLLPYPGMSGNRGEHLFRASASSMMRKLSRASIATGFTKRSASFTSLTNSKFDEVEESSDITQRSGGGVVSADSSGATPTGLLAGHPRLHCKSDSTGHVPTLRQIVPPARTSSKHGTRSRESRGTGSTEKNTADSRAGKVEFATSTGVKPGEKTLRNRWSSPISLIRSLSTEGMKHIFA